jgi:hypothetical protein
MKHDDMWQVEHPLVMVNKDRVVLLAVVLLFYLQQQQNAKCSSK